MITLTYVSDATARLQSGDVFKIVEASARNNSRRDLTGFLIFSNDRFFQVLEGPAAEVDALLSTLSADDRHDNIRILLREEIAERSFPNWGMKRLVEGRQGSTAEDVLDSLPSQNKRLREQIVAFLDQ